MSETKLTQEVNALTLRQAVLQERETILQQKSSELTGQLSKLNNEASAREEEYVVPLRVPTWSKLTISIQAQTSQHQMLGSLLSLLCR